MQPSSSSPRLSADKFHFCFFEGDLLPKDRMRPYSRDRLAPASCSSSPFEPSCTPQLRPSRPQSYSRVLIEDRPITCPICSYGGLVLKHLPVIMDKASLLRSNSSAPGTLSPMPKASSFALQTGTCPHTSSGQEKPIRKWRQRKQRRRVGTGGRNDLAYAGQFYLDEVGTQHRCSACRSRTCRLYFEIRRGC